MVHCFDIVNKVINEILLPINNDKLQRLEYYCSLIDDLCMEEMVNGSAYEVIVDQPSLDVSITLTCYSFNTLNNKDSAFLDVSKYAKRMRLYNLDPEEDLIQITFIFNGVWDV